MSDTSKRVYTQVFGVVGAIIERDGKFLLVRENNPPHPDHGKWNQPAGWIDLGENPITAVSREVREETGLEFVPAHVLGVYSLVRKDNAGKFGPGSMPHPLKIIFCGAAKSAKTQFDSSEISETRWFSPEEVYTMDGETLRDSNIKKEIRDYLSGKRYPLDIITHTVQE